jgi:hypothetical protein
MHVAERREFQPRIDQRPPRYRLSGSAHDRCVRREAEALFGRSDLRLEPRNIARRNLPTARRARREAQVPVRFTQLKRQHQQGTVKLTRIERDDLFDVGLLSLVDNRPGRPKDRQVMAPPSRLWQRRRHDFVNAFPTSVAKAPGLAARAGRTLTCRAGFAPAPPNPTDRERRSARQL